MTIAEHRNESLRTCTSIAHYSKDMQFNSEWNAEV